MGWNTGCHWNIDTLGFHRGFGGAYTCAFPVSSFTPFVSGLNLLLDIAFRS